MINPKAQIQSSGTQFQFTKPQPYRAQDHQASSLYTGQGWARKKFIKWGQIEGVKDMNWAGARTGPKPCIKPP